MLFGSVVSLEQLTECLTEFVVGTSKSIHLHVGEGLEYDNYGRFLRNEVFV